MQAPMLPHDEEARLGTLYRLNILDTPEDDRFDRYTRICQRLFDMPIVLISLVDRYRQWFKSAQGLPQGETSRDISFCGHAILGDDVFEIRNARRDKRFRDNPLVTEGPHIRFYAGAPLIAPNGHKLGTLCLIDRVPRRLKKDDKSVLIDMADMVVDEMVAYVDVHSGALNRNGLRALGGKAMEGLRADVPGAEMLLFDACHLLPAGNPPAEQAGTPVLLLVSEILRAAAPALGLVAHTGGGNFCALFDPARCEGKGSSRELIIRQVSVAVKQAVPTNDLTKEFALFVGGIPLSDPRHDSIDEVIREADAKFYERQRQLA